MIRTKMLHNCTAKLKYLYNTKLLNAKFNVLEELEKDNFKISCKHYEGFNFTRLQIFLNTKTNITICSCEINGQLNLSQFKNIFCKGYQSWSETGLYKTNENFKNLNFLAKPLMGQMGDNNLLSRQQKKGLRSWNYTYLNLENQNTFFIGSCNEHTAFTIFQFRKPNTISVIKDIKHLELPKNRQFLLYDLFLFEGNKEEAFDLYFDFLDLKKNTALETPEKTPKKAGYTSWYYHFNKITAAYLNEQLSAFKKHHIKFNYFQIDDGWQNTVGDWLTINPNFGGQMCCLAKSITNNGYEPGIWLAPFICTTQSFIYKQHKNWLLKDGKGKPIQSGYNPLWGGWHYALDFYNEDLRKYLKKVFDTLFKLWKFKMVKLDFLYAVGLAPPPHKTRAQVFYEAMQWLRNVCGNNEILGCGVPLLPAIETTNYCRIGPDADFAWKHWLRKVNHRERLSTINALQNSITLNHLNAYGFINDTDVCILRKHKNQLTLQQKITQLYVNYVFGDLFFISDEIEAYDDVLLQLYKSCFPLKTAANIKTQALKTQVFKSTFTINKSAYKMYINLSEEPYSFFLKDDEETYYDCVSKQPLYKKEMLLPPHQLICLLNMDDRKASDVKDVEHLLPGII